MTPTAADPAPDAVYDLLSSPARRAVLRYLHRRARPATIDELARVVAGRNRGPIHDDRPDAAVRRAVVSLQHVHLPKLERAGAIEYGGADGSVALGESPAPLLTHLTLDEAESGAARGRSGGN